MAKRFPTGTSLFFHRLLFTALFLSLGGCRNQENDQQTLTVAAAISLRPALSELETTFEEEHPGVDLVLHFASSGSLSLQIRNGAPIDVFCTAHPRHLHLLEESGLVQPDRVQELARNRLVLAWSASGQDCFEEDLARLDPEAAFRLLHDPCIERIAVGEPVAVPAGTYADEVLTFFNLREALEGRRILTRDALQILTYLANNRAHVGILYRTDARRLPEGTPLAWPGIAAGIVLTFLRALGEFGATLMIAGNIPGRTQTAPVALFFAVEAGDPTLAWILCAFLIGISILALLLSGAVNRWRDR